jgi:cathepsin B
VYEDFFSYKSGVYSPTSTSVAGGHAIKVLGWGVESGKKYWLCANSWGSGWGMSGYIYIDSKGSDDGGQGECGILEAASYPTK